MGPVMLWYNSKIFSAYHLAVPTTWSQYIQEGKLLKTHGIAMLELANAYLTNPVQPDTTIFQFLLQEAGGSLYSSSGKATVDSAAGQLALKLFEEMYSAGIGININRWTPAEWDAARAGKFATIIDAGWMLDTFPSYITTPAQGFGDWRVALMPRIYPTVPSGATDGGSYLVVPEQITGTQRTAALDFTKFMTTNFSALVNWANVGLIPSYLPVYKDPAIANSSHPVFGTQKVLPLIAQAATLLPKTVYEEPAAYEQATNYIDSTIGQVASGAAHESTTSYLNSLTTQLNQFQAPYSS